VPSACNASLNGRGCTTVVVTVTGRPGPGDFPAALSCLPQATTASSDRHANAGRRNRSGAFFDIDGIHSRQPSEFSGWLVRPACAVGPARARSTDHDVMRYAHPRQIAPMAASNLREATPTT